MTWSATLSTQSVSGTDYTQDLGIEDEYVMIPKAYGIGQAVPPGHEARKALPNIAGYGMPFGVMECQLRLCS